MRKNHFIFFSILSAYLLMLTHSIVPHHHHENTQEAEHHHEQEHTTHLHVNQHSAGHEHTSHFVHPPDFGNYIVASSYKLTDVPQLNTDLLFTVASALKLSVQHFEREIDWYPDLPPPYKSYNPLSHSLRGPPHFISQA